MRSSALTATFSQKISTNAPAIGNMSPVSPIYRQKRKPKQAPSAIAPRRGSQQSFAGSKPIKIAAFLKARLFLCSFFYERGSGISFSSGAPAKKASRLPSVV